MRGTVRPQSDRPIPLERMHFPPAEPHDKVDPFDAAVVMPHDVRTPEAKGNYLEAVLVLATAGDGERIFVRFHRSGNTAWVDTDRLVDR